MSLVLMVGVSGSLCPGSESNLSTSIASRLYVHLKRRLVGRREVVDLRPWLGDGPWKGRRVRDRLDLESHVCPGWESNPHALSGPCF